MGATYGKDADEVLLQIMDIQFKLPFLVLSFNTENLLRSYRED